MKKCYIVLFVLISILNTDVSAQNLTDVDTTLLKNDSTNILFTKFGNLNLSGYIQAQYQKASSEGVEIFPVETLVNILTTELCCVELALKLIIYILEIRCQLSFLHCK